MSRMILGFGIVLMPCESEVTVEDARDWTIQNPASSGPAVEIDLAHTGTSKLENTVELFEKVISLYVRPGRTPYSPPTVSSCPRDHLVSPELLTRNHFEQILCRVSHPCYFQ
jgi:hypothetical protein